MAEAIRALGFFVFQQDLDSPEDVMEVLRGARVAHAVNMDRVDKRQGIYIVEPLERGCRRTCVYEGGCGNDRRCLDACVERCMEQLRNRVAEALMRYAERARA
jgi:hypothetical protein